jgi:two-component system sensor histidine kinase KdpD
MALPSSSSVSIVWRYVAAVLLCVGMALLCLPLIHYLDLANIVMLFLLVVALVAVVLGKGPAAVSAFVCVALFDFLFVEPRFSFAVHDGQYLITFSVMLLVALLIGHLIEIAQKNAGQVQAERLRSSILSALSHDVRTPLTVLCGLADTLKLTHPDLPETARDIVDVLREQAVRLHSMVDNLLDMARLQSGNIVLNKEWQPLEEVIGASIHLLGDALASHKVHVDIAVDIPLVNIDALLLERVFCNLLENACKYSPLNSMIVIRAGTVDHAVEIVVINEGIGFPDNDTQRLLDVFERGKNESTASGFGVGLAICRSIIEAHGGSIRAFNPDWGGACVAFTLPVGIPPVIELEDNAEQSLL